MLAFASVHSSSPSHSSCSSLRTGTPASLAHPLHLVGAATFIAVDVLLQRRAGAQAAGLALVAAVTLDGVPENLALGVGLAESASYALLASIVLSNLPEAFSGAAKMREGGASSARVLGVGSDGRAARLRSPRGKPRTSHPISGWAC